MSYPVSTLKEQMFKRITGWLSWLVFSLVVIVMAFVMVTSRNGWQYAAVLSGSMEPGIHVGGLVVIEPVDTTTLKVGDVISFMASAVSTNTSICHRIIDIQYQKGIEYFQTKGDANNSPDQFLTSVTNVKGKEIFYISYVGRLADVKKLGATPISVIGMSIPLAIILVTCMGLLFIGLILKDTVESIFWPGRQWQREANKKRKERYAIRRKTFNL